jgi:hypothetical protein
MTRGTALDLVQIVSDLSAGRPVPTEDREAVANVVHAALELVASMIRGEPANSHLKAEIDRASVASEDRIPLKQAAALYDVSEATARRWAIKGMGEKVGGRWYLVRSRISTGPVERRTRGVR